MSTERAAQYRFTGKGQCRWCGQPPPKGRRNWCSDACVEEFTVRAWPSKMRAKVLERDRGICRKCGRDCVALAERIIAWIGPERIETGEVDGYGYRVGRDLNAAEAKRRLRAIRLATRLRLVNGYSAWNVSARSLWEANHIVPVIEGGGGCGLDNIETLCRCCHRGETAALARRRAEARSPQMRLPGVTA